MFFRRSVQGRTSPVFFGVRVFFGAKETRSCPSCGAQIKHEAIKCRFCGAFSKADSDDHDTCIACQVMAGICVLIALVGMAVFLWQSGSW